MSRKPRLESPDAFDTVSVPVVSDLDGVGPDGTSNHAVAVSEWSAKHLATGEQDRLAGASGTNFTDDLTSNVARLEADIAAHKTSSLHEAQRRALGYGLGGLLVGGLLGGAITAALLRRAG